MAERPWRTLRDRPEIELMVCDLPVGVRAIYATRDGDRAILVNRALPPAERLAAVAHELKHDERGGGCHHADAPPLLRVADLREERRVEAAVAEDLLPLEELRRYAEQREPFGLVLAWEVADDFDVPVHVADLALQRLAAGF